MSRWGEEVWLRDLPAAKVARIRKKIETDGFWSYVDTQANAYVHPGDCEIKQGHWGWRVNCSDWTHVRGESCVAANGGLTQCTMPTLSGIPFCGFHFDRVWTALVTFVGDERAHAASRDAEFDIEREKERRLRSLGVEVAQAIDAQRLLAASPERVYFFAAGDFVKVGRSRDPERRVKSLGSTLAPDAVDLRSGSLLGTIPGGPAVESALHAEFIAHRVKGEWFDLAPIRERIAELLTEHSSLADTG